jgi:two-component system NarL family sensor kinase
MSLYLSTKRTPRMSAVARPALRAVPDDARTRRSRLRFGATSDDPSLDLAPVSIRGLLTRFLLAGLATVLVVSVIGVRVSQNLVTHLAIDEARTQSINDARHVVEPLLVDSILGADPFAIRRLDEAVRAQLLGSSLISVNVWSQAGTIVYSSEPRLIGAQFELDERERALFAGHAPLAQVSNLTAPENRYEQGGKLLEVYLLARTTEGTPVLYEAYYQYSGVTAAARTISRRFIPIMVGAVLIVELIQIPLAMRLARSVQSAQRRRERLLGHALAASEADRRRIADGLHGGPLQGLAGSLMSLAAMSAAIDGPDSRLDAASAGIRESVESLRSMVVDISPPSTPDVNLQVALAALLDRLEARHVATSMTVSSEAGPVGSNARALIVRTAQELVRDALANDTVKSFSIDLTNRDGAVEFLAADDRVHDSGSPWDRTPTDAGAGLVAALGDLIRDAGGHLTTGRQRSAGQWTRLEIPWLDDLGSAEGT